MKYFKLSEFLRSETAEANGLDMTPPADVKARLEALTEHVLDPLRERLGRPVRVTSGWRSPALNRLVGGSRTSQHCKGEAADIQVSSVSPIEVCQTIIEAGLPFDQLIYEFGQWTHVSYGPRNRREVLTARKQGRRTVYLRGLQP